MALSRRVLPRPLVHTVLQGLCDQALADCLQLTIKQVLGTQPVVAVGGRYIVSGVYTLSAGPVALLRLACQGTSSGMQAAVAPGSGAFELSAEPRRVEKGAEHTLDVLMADREGEHLGVRARISLDG